MTTRPPPGPCAVCKETGYWKRDRPSLQREGDRTHFPARDPELEKLAGWGPAAGPAPSAIKTTEPRVTLDVGGELTSFLTDAGATGSGPPQHSGPTRPSNLTVAGTEGETETCRQTVPGTCRHKNRLVAQVFRSFRRVPPITGRDFMDKPGAVALFLQRTTACFSNV